MQGNMKYMQNYANEQKVNLRPHTKTHKMPKLAKLQEEMGAYRNRCGESRRS